MFFSLGTGVSGKCTTCYLGKGITGYVNEQVSRSITVVPQGAVLAGSGNSPSQKSGSNSSWKRQGTVKGSVGHVEWFVQVCKKQANNNHDWSLLSFVRASQHGSASPRTSPAESPGSVLC